MAYADWIVSSRDWTTQTITIDAGSQDVTAASGGLYLVHTTASLSLLDRLVAAMTAASVSSPAAFVTESRYVRLTAGATFTITWGAGTELRDLLGFEADLSGASSYTATLRSTLLWSAGKILTPELAPRGAHGIPVFDGSASSGPAGRIVARRHGAPSVVNRYTARHVEKARYLATPPTAGAGDFWHFWENEAWTNQRMMIILNVTEGSSTTASADYGSAQIVGPYRVDLTQRDVKSPSFGRDTGFERVDAYYGPITVPVVQCEEFS